MASRMWKWSSSDNPARSSLDERLRRMERRATAGDPGALEAYVREAERAGVGRSSDEASLGEARKLREMRQAIGRPVREPENACYVVEDLGEYQTTDGRTLRGFNAYLDGRRINNSALAGEEGLLNQIRYDRRGLHPYSRDFWWNESIDRQHYECPTCRPIESRTRIVPKPPIKKVPARRGRRRRLNPDEPMRRAERARAVGGPREAADVLRWRMRSGELAEDQVRMAARLGRLDALELFPQEPPVAWVNWATRRTVILEASRLAGGRRWRRVLVAWVCDVAERVLPLFERERPEDDRPRQAISLARRWARGEKVPRSRLEEAAASADDAAAYAAAYADAAREIRDEAIALLLELCEVRVRAQGDGKS